MKNKLKKFYEEHTKKKIAVTLLAFLFLIGVGVFFTYQSLNTSDNKIAVGSVKNSSNTKKENTEETSKGVSEEHTDETVSDQNQETSGEVTQGSESTTGHTSTPASNTSQGNAGASPSTSSGHVHNYVPVYQDVPAEGYWQFVPGQTVTETWVLFSNGVEMRYVTDEEARKVDEYSAYNGLFFSEFEKILSQTPAQEVWVETKPAQTVLVGYQCTIDGSWK
ncbi:MAG: hypothetical protein K2L08_03975 [Erysipelotrichaceae bacterium]|nr:hypothetical protein [Erysipelotrichaceae bacterium]